MRNLCRAVAAFLAVAAPLLVVPARAEWPERPIRIVAPYAPGGANDLIARAVGDGVSRRLKNPVVVENKPGAGGALGADVVAKSKPDGYTYLVGGAFLISNNVVRKDLPYSESDLVPVGMMAVAPSVIVVNPEVPAKTLAEFVAWAKSQGTQGVNWSTAGTATTPHFVAEMLKEEAGITNLRIVPYKSGADGVTAVLSNNVSATSEASIVVLPYLKSGRLRALATTYEKRITAYPSLVTTNEAGFPGVSIGHWAGLFAPKGTPTAVLDRMNAELRVVVQGKEFSDKFVPQGIEPAPYSLIDFVSFLDKERTRLTRIARVAKMQAD